MTTIKVNGRDASLDGVPVHTTVLDWLRDRGLTGAKEGCAEGECGACSVLVARPGIDTPTQWTAINACLLPAASLDGQEIITSEGLGKSTALHPVQQEMAVRGGSQCGFCTPGFICSMAAEYYRPNRTTPIAATAATTAAADGAATADGACDHEHGPNGFDLHALSGNLCRCTGYRPIRDAAYALGTPSPDDVLAARRSSPPPPPVATHLSTNGAEFLRPTTLAEVLDILADRPEARLVAGSTDAGVEVNIRGLRPPLVIAIDRLPELREFTWSPDPGEADGLDQRSTSAELSRSARQSELGGPAKPGEAHGLDQLRRAGELGGPDAPDALGGDARPGQLAALGGHARPGQPAVPAGPGEVRIGAALTLSEIERLLGGRVPLLGQLFPQFASRLIRNGATIGGNLGTGSPIGDTPPALLALDASLVLASGRGERVVPLADYFTGYRQTLKAPDELIRSIVVPLPLASMTAFHKIAKRRFDDISSVAIGYAVEVADGVVTRARIGLGGVAATPLRARATEDALVGRPWTEQTVREAAGVLTGEGTPMDDHRASSAYRSAMLGQSLLRFYAQQLAAEGISA